MSTDKLTQRYLQYSGLLLEEVRPFLTGQPMVRARRFGEVVSFGETFAQIARSRVPFAHGAMRTDTMVFHDLPTRQGLLHIVQNYGGQALQPTDFLLVLDRSIPRAAWAKDEGLLSTKWATPLTETGQRDTFKEFLDSL